MSSILSEVTGAAARTDCHLHVFGAVERFPLRRPGLVAQLPQAEARHLAARCAALHVDGGVIVNPIEYGADTACLEDALAVLGAGFTGAIMAGPDMDAAALARLDALGVKALRLMYPARLGLAPGDATIAAAIATARRFGWHLRVLAGPDDWPRVAQAFGAVADVPILLEHLAICAPQSALAGDERYGALCGLLRRPNVWLQFSGAMRLAPEAEWAPLLRLVRRHYDLCAGRCVWGSDWPHIGGASGDDAASLRFAEAVCSTAGERQRLFHDEPRALLRGHESITTRSTGRASA